jgi:hypothetical protein
LTAAARSGPTFVQADEKMLKAEQEIRPQAEDKMLSNSIP